MGAKKYNFNSFLIAVLAVLVLFLFNSLMTPQSSGVQINFLDVGQGDATLITNSHNQSILIDGGPNSQVTEKISEYLPFYQHKITTIILTHPHADHLIGLIDVLKKYEVKNVYSTGVIHTTPEYLEFLELVKNKNITFKTLKAGDKLTYEDDLVLNVLYPLVDMSGRKIDNLNNSSIVVKASYGEMDAILMGDLESEGQENLTQSTSLQSEIIKVPHHGSSDSVHEKIIDKVKAQIAIFSQGKDNKFKHPSQKALDAYRNAKIYRTDQDGTIRIKLSKEKIVSIESN